MSAAAYSASLDAERAPTTLGGVVVAGLLSIAIGFGGFAAWGFLASLDSAAVAHGVVIVQSQSKTVQHFEGGFLKAMHVSDGDRVKKGQLLLELDATASQATLDKFDTEYWAALARIERLRAERDRQADLTFSDALLAAAERPAVAEILETERDLMVSGRVTHEGRIAVNEARIAQIRQEIKALEAQTSARIKQLEISRKELTKSKGLIARGFESPARAVEQELRVAELTGEHAELLANIARAQHAMKEAELSTVSLHNDRLASIYADLEATQRLAADLRERRRAAEDVARRTRVTAPQAGFVTNVRIHTLGGVIAPGQPILDIVPVDEDLVVEARVDPKDIDSVRAGLDTRVRLTAYRQRTTPTVQGQVSYVSADLMSDERSGKTYFLARVTLDPGSLAELERVELYPGMPAEVLIVTGRRKAIDYFIAPFADVMSRALREE